MKKVLMFIVSLVLVINTFGQDTTNKAELKSFYLRKSKNQKTTAWILLSGGTALMVAGSLAYINNDLSNMFSETNPDNSGPIALMVIGGLADIASIHFFISGHKNKERAAEVSVSNQQFYLPQNNFVATKYAPVITFKIRL